MPTLRTVTVKSSGGDYSSLSAAEAGEQANLVSLDRQLDIACYAMDDTSSCNINGWTTDATRYVRVYAASGEGHSGVWTTSKYRQRSNSGFGTSLSISEEYVRIEGLQIYTGASGYTSAIRINVTTTSDVRIDKCIIKGPSGTGALLYMDSGCVTVRNSLIYGGVTDGFQGWNSGGSGHSLTMENVTVVANARYGVNYVASSATVTLTNCYSGGNTTDDYAGTITRTTCKHSSATSFSGSTASTAYSTANFTNVTASSENLALVSGSALLDAGTDLSGSFTVDIAGTTRPQNGTFDIGAFEYVGSAPSSTAKLVRRFGGTSFLVSSTLVG